VVIAVTSIHRKVLGVLYPDFTLRTTRHLCVGQLVPSAENSNSKLVVVVLLRSSTMDLLTVPRTDFFIWSPVAFLWLDHESAMDFHMSYDSATHFRVSSLT